MNILTIIIDSLRADHLSCYGYPRDTSPHLDALAAQGALVEGMFVPGIPTHPAFATFYTGQHPITHGVVAHGGHTPLAEDAPFFTRDLQAAGWYTGAVDNLHSTRPWYNRGYADYLDWTGQTEGRVMANCEQVNRLALPWLRQHAAAPFFLMVHYWDTHTTYHPPARLRHRYYQADPTDPRHTSLQAMRQAPLGEIWADHWMASYSRKLFGGREIRDAEYVVALYDACIRWVDEAVGELLETLEQTGTAEDTLVLVMADHGEMHYDHGIFFDHHGLYDGNIRIPCLVRWPGRIPAGQRLSGVTQTTNLAPTLLAAAGLPPAPGMEGRSLLPALIGEEALPADEPVIAEECTWQAKWCLRQGGRKFIVARQPDLYQGPMRELYDLATDPDELRNLADARPEVTAAMEAQLEAWIAARLRARGLSEDPLLAHGITLGKAWAEEHASRGDLNGQARQ